MVDRLDLLGVLNPEVGLGFRLVLRTCDKFLLYSYVLTYLALQESVRYLVEP